MKLFRTTFMTKVTKNHFCPKKKIKRDRRNLSQEENDDKTEEEEEEDESESENDNRRIKKDKRNRINHHQIKKHNVKTKKGIIDYINR